jgi:hypothetical protein
MYRMNQSSLDMTSNCPGLGFGPPTQIVEYSPMHATYTGENIGTAQNAWDKTAAWMWTDRTAVEKAAVVVGGASIVGLIVYAVVAASRPRRYRPNLSAAERARVKEARVGSQVTVGSKRYKIGKIIKVKGGRVFGHKVPPKKYRDKGARRQDDYAWPAGYKYPVVFRTKTGRIKPTLSARRTRAAAAYFGKNKHLYPPAVRRTIARNINRAKKRFGIGGKAARP